MLTTQQFFAKRSQYTLIMVLGLVGACSEPPYPRGGLAELYPLSPPPEVKRIILNNQVLNYAELAQAGTAPVIFVHGSPGDWQAWAHYLSDAALANYGPLLSVDRPGWGGSESPEVVTDLQAQADLFSQLLPADQRSIVVGHSLGGPIAAWMAIDHPDLICGAVIVAGSLAPKLEGMRWYNELATWKLLRPMIPQSLLRSNREIQFLQSELQQLEPAWPQLQRPTLVLQGMQDELVDPRTADYMEEIAVKGMAAESLIQVQRFPDQGHFLLWESPALVTDAITSLDCDN